MRTRQGTPSSVASSQAKTGFGTTEQTNTRMGLASHPHNIIPSINRFLGLPNEFQSTGKTCWWNRDEMISASNEANPMVRSPELDAHEPSECLAIPTSNPELDTSKVRLATASDIPAVVELLVRALDDDPVSNFMFAGDRRRHLGLQSFFASQLRPIVARCAWHIRNWAPPPGRNGLCTCAVMASLDSSKAERWPLGREQGIRLRTARGSSRPPKY